LLAHIVEPTVAAPLPGTLEHALALFIGAQPGALERGDLRRKEMLVRPTHEAKLDHPLEYGLAESVLFSDREQLTLERRIVAEAGDGLVHERG
jgi:hypothetical protein